MGGVIIFIMGLLAGLFGAPMDYDDQDQPSDRISSQNCVQSPISDPTVQQIAQKREDVRSVGDFILEKEDSNRSKSFVRPLVEGIAALCGRKFCDGVEPDEVAPPSTYPPFQEERPEAPEAPEAVWEQIDIVDGT